MASILRPFTVIAKATRAFFKADLKVQRGDRGIEVVLAERPPKPEQPRRGAKPLDAAAQKERQDLQRIQQSLTALLDELPDNRTALRQLAFIEHALSKKGMRALHKVPYDVLKRALEQFEGVVVNWSDEGLATLRSKMAVVLIEREPESTVARDATPGEAPNSALDSVPLAHPVALEGPDADEAEAALRAAYGGVVLTGLTLTAADEPAVELVGELNSPSAKAIAKAVRRGEDVRETQY